jgi:cytochrome c oxidase cbb3-type subunit IV
METINGVALYPIISLIIFFAFFVGLGYWVFSYKKEKIKELSDIPLRDN